MVRGEQNDFHSNDPFAFSSPILPTFAFTVYGNIFSTILVIQYNRAEASLLGYMFFDILWHQIVGIG